MVVAFLQVGNDFVAALGGVAIESINGAAILEGPQPGRQASHLVFAAALATLAAPPRRAATCRGPDQRRPAFRAVARRMLQIASSFALQCISSSGIPMAPDNPSAITANTAAYLCSATLNFLIQGVSRISRNNCQASPETEMSSITQVIQVLSGAGGARTRDLRIMRMINAPEPLEEETSIATKRATGEPQWGCREKASINRHIHGTWEART